MKKIILSLFVLLPMFLNAAIRTDVTITDLNNNALTQNIERNLSALISELNSAVSGLMNVLAIRCLCCGRILLSAVLRKRLWRLV